MAESELTPEEKLLRVIQNGGASATDAQPETVQVEAPADHGGGNVPVDAAPASGSGGLISLRALSRWAAGIAVLLLAGAAYELYANVPTATAPLPPLDASFLDVAVSSELPLTANTVDDFAKRRIFGEAPEHPRPPPDPERMSGWRAYIRDHFKMMGVSTLEREGADGQKQNVPEAIIMDKKVGTMYFLSPGSSLMVGVGDDRSDVVVKSVVGDAVRFASDGIEMTFSKEGAQQ